MINSRSASERSLGALEITPLIDIVFIIVVFLIITANTPLLTLAINVPDADQEATLSEGYQQTFLVTITPQKPYWHIGTQDYQQWSDFKRALLMEINTNEKGLTIAADKAAPIEPLLQLLSLLNQQQFTNTKIIMKTPGEML
ncbi:MAG: biopolymer transport protein ExbD [Gammaproteobacteria bacterium]|jgi:biopolymer transport protein ExbD